MLNSSDDLKPLQEEQSMFGNRQHKKMIQKSKSRSRMKIPKGETHRAGTLNYPKSLSPRAAMTSITPRLFMQAAGSSTHRSRCDQSRSQSSKRNALTPSQLSQRRHKSFDKTETAERFMSMPSFINLLQIFDLRTYSSSLMPFNRVYHSLDNQRQGTLDHDQIFMLFSALSDSPQL